MRFKNRRVRIDFAPAKFQQGMISLNKMIWINPVLRFLCLGLLLFDLANTLAGRQEGVYLEANVGFNIVSIPIVSESPIAPLAGFVWNADFGYQANRYIAAELG